ncbi:phosphatase PAP2 family protein [Nocardioides pacificus]
MTPVYRRAYVLLIGVTVMMAVLALIAAASLDRRVVDPEGFLGPAWARGPLLVGAAFLADVLPRMLWGSRMHPKKMLPIARARVKEHWTRERLTLVVLGIICFYGTYVCYRNLKSFLPDVLGLDYKFDRELHLIDQALFFGHEPAVVLHSLIGFDWVSHVLSVIYLVFLPLVPIMVTIWVVWSRNISFGYWFCTAQVLAWTLGTASYYALPTLGPGFRYPWLYQDLAYTGTTSLMDSLFYGRAGVLHRDLQGAVQSVAGFASLHVAITLLVALMAQYTMRNRIVHWVLWINFGLTVIATLYFGWHYVADDIAGIAIALISFYIGGIATGQKFDRKGLAAHPTTDSSAVPVELPADTAR